MPMTFLNMLNMPMTYAGFKKPLPLPLLLSLLLWITCRYGMNGKNKQAWLNTPNGCKLATPLKSDPVFQAKRSQAVAAFGEG